jgi:hypothetical protein
MMRSGRLRAITSDNRCATSGRQRSALDPLTQADAYQGIMCSELSVPSEPAPAVPAPEDDGDRRNPNVRN